MRFLPLVLVLGICQAAELRTWTDVQARKVEATLLRVGDQAVVLKLKDGREISYPLTKLSEPDRQYVEQNRALIPSMKELPAAPKAVDTSEKFNFGDAWPERIKFAEDPEINTVVEDADKKSFIYESANYRYMCDVRLAKSVVKGFAVMFEATQLYCRTLPLAINGGVKIEGKYQILLFEKFEDYVKAGGPASSSGVFIGGKNAVLVPLKSIGVKPVGSGYMLDRDKSSNTIPHELTHQVSPPCYFAEGAMGWFSEGIAEYVANTPYRSGTFSVRGNQKPIVEYATGYGSKDMGGRALGTKIHMPALKGFMTQTYSNFTETAQLSYGCSLLLTTYFLHMDGAGDGKRMKAFLKALHEGKEGDQALEVLLDGRTFEKLQEEITKAWSHKGIDFTFSS